MPQFDVFLSHNSVDKPWVIQLKDDLLRYGVSVWLDKDEIRPGDLFAEALEQALNNCRAVALIVSPNALSSGWVKEEYYHALSLTKAKKPPLRLIPVILKDVELPGFLKSRHWVDFRDESAYNENVRELVWGITGKRPDEVLDLTPPVSTERPGKPRTWMWVIGIAALILATVVILGVFLGTNYFSTSHSLVASTDIPTSTHTLSSSYIPPAIGTSREAPTPVPDSNLLTGTPITTTTQTESNTPEPSAPTATFTSTPTLTPTPTPSPTETETPTPTSTPSPTPSSVPTAVTPTLIPTATPPSLVGPTPVSLCAAVATSGQAEFIYPAPTLHEPGNGTVYVGPTAEIVLSWDPIELQNGDAYVVTTIRHHDPDGYYCDYQFTRDTSFTVPAYICDTIVGGRDIEWYVAGIRNGDTIDVDGATKLIGEILSPISERRTFVWNVIETEPNGPGPKPPPPETK